MSNNVLVNLTLDFVVDGGRFVIWKQKRGTSGLCTNSKKREIARVARELRRSATAVAMIRTGKTIP
jgi:hypothetical protein